MRLSIRASVGPVVVSHELRVRARIDPDDGLERERVGNIRDRQMLGVERILARGECPAVDRHRFELQLVAVEHERRVYAIVGIRKGGGA
jgi:hypothetical protein